jgi:hypothetical protein
MITCLCHKLSQVINQGQLASLFSSFLDPQTYVGIYPISQLLFHAVYQFSSVYDWKAILIATKSSWVEVKVIVKLFSDFIFNVL